MNFRSLANLVFVLLIPLTAQQAAAMPLSPSEIAILFETEFESNPYKVEQALREAEGPIAKLYLAVFLHWEKPDLRVPDGEIAQLLEIYQPLDTAPQSGEENASEPGFYNGTSAYMVNFLSRYAVGRSQFILPCNFFRKYSEIGEAVTSLGVYRGRFGAVGHNCEDYFQERLPSVFAFWDQMVPVTWAPRTTCQGTITRDYGWGRLEAKEVLFFHPRKECPWCQKFSPASLRETTLYPWSLISLWNYRIYEEGERRFQQAVEDLSGYYVEIFSIEAEEATNIARTRLMSQLHGTDPLPKGAVLDRAREAILKGGALDKSIELAPRATALAVDDVRPNFSDAGVLEPLLLLAADNPDAIQRILEAGHNPDVTNVFGKTALMAAVQVNNTDAVRALLAGNARINAQSSHPVDIPLNNLKGSLNKSPSTCSPYKIFHGQRTALMYAAANADLETIKTLLDAGADPTITDSVGRTALDYIDGTIRGIEPNPLLEGHDLEEARHLLATPPNLHARDINGYTPLHLATNTNSVDMPAIEEILSANAGANLGYVVNAIDAYGHAPIYYAALGNNVDVIARLLAAGAEVNARMINAEAPLAAAVRRNSYEAAKMLIEAGARTDVSVVNYYSNDSVLKHAANKGYLGILGLLLGSDIYQGEDNSYQKAIFALLDANDFQTPRQLVFLRPLNLDHPSTLIDAAASGRWQVVKFLIEIGADVNAQGPYKHQPNALSAAEEPEIVRMLLEADADPNLRSEENRTPIMSVRSVEKARLLLEAGADPNAVVDRARTVDWWSAHLGSVDELKVFEVLLEYGFDIKAKEAAGVFPIAHARSVVAMEYLLDKGADITGTPSQYNSLLIYWARFGNIEIVRFLLSKGFDPNVRDGHDSTPIMYAKSREMLRLLIDAGAELNVVSKTGSTAISTAIFNNEPRLTRFLLRAGAKPDAAPRHKNLRHAVESKKIELIEILLLAGVAPDAPDEPRGDSIVTYARSRAASARNETEKLEWNRILELLEAAWQGNPLPIGPGYDCKRAGSAIEKAICADQELSILDYKMAKAYRDLRAGTPDEEAWPLIEGQRAWLRQRRQNCCAADPSPQSKTEMGQCLKSTTETRLTILEQMLRDAGL